MLCDAAEIISDARRARGPHTRAADCDARLCESSQMNHPDPPAHRPADPRRGECALIRRIKELLEHSAAPAGGGVPFGDDMSHIDPRGEMLWTTDMLMDGVDFDSRQHDWKTIGRKALAVSLSDCAAMGCRPIGALLAVSLNDGLSIENALEIVRGAHELATTFDCPINGGDTNSWRHPTVIATTVAGCAEAGQAPIRRDGARPGDRIYVSGPLGGSILGRHLSFTPRVSLGLELNRRLRPHTMIDISDGLALDLWRICEASGVGAVLDAGLLDRVIHSDAHALSARDGAAPREHALHDGEDFELLVALPASADSAALTALQLAPLGEIIGERSLRLRDEAGGLTPLAPRGWEHFR